MYFDKLILKMSVDISYLVTDFKYSQEHGIKICEVQHGSLSSLSGDTFITSNNCENIETKNGMISFSFAKFFDQFNMQKWIVGTIYKQLKKSLKTTGWCWKFSVKTLLEDKIFLEKAKQIPNDLCSIYSYYGIVFCASNIFKEYKIDRYLYPGILFMDAATLDYWIDKHKMNSLFGYHNELEKYKAEWKVYPKTYDSSLAEKIKNDLPCEIYIIKPLNEFLGCGIIVTTKYNLDNTLQLILKPDHNLKRHHDKKYSYWYKNNDTTFLIEKYYASDYLIMPEHLINETKTSTNDFHYDATMRFAFILKCDNGNISYHFLGAYWKLPCKAIEEEGTLNEKSITICSQPFYDTVEPILLKKINKEMKKVMLLFYKVMLGCY